MVLAGEFESADVNTSIYDRFQELKLFDESKSGVKGLVDSGITRVPRIFQRPQEDIAAEQAKSAVAAASDFHVPVIDLANLANKREELVERVLEAAHEVGFFQVVNHGIEEGLLEELLLAMRAFHELPREVKSEYYSRESKRRVAFMSNFSLYTSKPANWRDGLLCLMEPELLDPQELPPVCREAIMEYSKQVKVLGATLFELLSEALGLEPDYLANMDCLNGHSIVGNYYPACPEPELAIGTTKHSDPSFLTILLQDNTGGLQVYYQERWVDLHPVPGALVVNIGDMLQLMSNDLFKSVEHQVLANRVGPRISVACFFTLYLSPRNRMYGPIKELVSEDKPAVYRETTFEEYIIHYNSKGLDGVSALKHFRMVGH